MAAEGAMFPPGVAPGSAVAVRLTEMREEAYARVMKCIAAKPYDNERSRLLTELRETLFVDTDVHLEILTAGQRGEIPPRIEAAAAARGAPNAASGASSNYADGDASAPLYKSSRAQYAGGALGPPMAGHANGQFLKRHRSSGGDPCQRGAARAKQRLLPATFKGSLMTEGAHYSSRAGSADWQDLPGMDVGMSELSDGEKPQLLPVMGIQLPHLQQHQQQHQSRLQDHFGRQSAPRSAGFLPDGNPGLSSQQWAGGMKRPFPCDAVKPALKRNKMASALAPAKAAAGAAERAVFTAGVNGGRGDGMATVKLLINPLVGRKVETWYPDHGGWYPGIITDYNLENDKHCVCYDVGQEDESFEWICIRRAKKEDFRLLTVKVDVLNLPIRTANPSKRSVSKVGVGGSGIRQQKGSSAVGRRGGQRASPAAFAPQALPSQQSQQTSVVHQVLTPVAVPTTTTATGNFAAAAVARPARPRPSTGRSRLKKLAAVGGRAGAKAAASRAAARAPAAMRLPPPQESRPPPLPPPPVVYTGAAPPKVAPPPRPRDISIGRRLSESDDGYSDGLRGNMRDSPTPSRSSSPEPQPEQHNSMSPYTRAQPPTAISDQGDAYWHGDTPLGGSPVDGGSAGAVPAAAVQPVRTFANNIRQPADPTPSPPPGRPSPGQCGASPPDRSRKSPAERYTVEDFKAPAQPEEEAQALRAEGSVQRFADVAPEHQFRIVSSSDDDDSDSDTGGY